MNPRLRLLCIYYIYFTALVFGFVLLTLVTGYLTFLNGGRPYHLIVCDECLRRCHPGELNCIMLQSYLYGSINASIMIFIITSFYFVYRVLMFSCYPRNWYPRLNEHEVEALPHPLD